MAKGSVNKVILIGRMGADAEVRTTPSGATVANFNLATNRSWKKDDEWQEETDWHRCVLWNRHAEIANEYAGKGSRVYVEGRLQTRDWEDKDGQKRYTTEVVATDFQLLDSKGENGPPAAQQEAPAAVSDEDVPF